MPLISYQPFKVIYLFFAIVWELSRFPLWVFAYALPFLRPNPNWSLEQAIRVRVVKLFLRHYSAVRHVPRISLEPGREGERFSVVQPLGIYKGATDDKVIRPQKVGVTWTPSALQRSQVSDGVEVVLHFHGGAYIMGDGRDEDAGFLAKTIHKNAGVTHVMCPQYRLACIEGGRYPAALQDAISCYTFLIEKLRVPPSNITLSGDSAGGNLAMALLRYINDYGKNLGLPWPANVWLWSPWIDVPQALDPHLMVQSPQYNTDYLNTTFGAWGANALTDNGKIHPRDPYVTVLGSTFQSKTPIFIQTGGSEVLLPSNIELYQQLKKGGTKTELVIVDHAPHDILLIGNLLGFEKEISVVVKQAGNFLRVNRLK